MIDFLAVFITFFAVIDPIGTIPVYIAVTDKHDQKTKRRVALLATIVSACVLLFFVVIGEPIIKGFVYSTFRISNIWGNCFVSILAKYDIWR